MIDRHEERMAQIFAGVIFFLIVGLMFACCRAVASRPAPVQKFPAEKAVEELEVNTAGSHFPACEHAKVKCSEMVNR